MADPIVATHPRITRLANLLCLAVCASCRHSVNVGDLFYDDLCVARVINTSDRFVTFDLGCFEPTDAKTARWWSRTNGGSFTKAPGECFAMSTGTLCVEPSVSGSTSDLVVTCQGAARGCER